MIIGVLCLMLVICWIGCRMCGMVSCCGNVGLIFLVV